MRIEIRDAHVRECLPGTGGFMQGSTALAYLTTAQPDPD
jgi:hypothetical protein